MQSLYGAPLESGPVVVTWACGDDRRVIVPTSYAYAKTYWQRILGSRLRRPDYIAKLHAEVGVLHQPGSVLPAIVGPHEVALVKPYLFGALQGPSPVLVCLGGERPAQALGFPVLVSDEAEAERFVGHLQAKGVPRRHWRRYLGERPVSEPEKLFVELQDGSIAIRSRLEERLSEVIDERIPRA